MGGRCFPDVRFFAWSALPTGTRSDAESPDRQPATRPRVSQQIRAREVRLVDADGRQLGIRPLRRALFIAREAGIDPVETAPAASPSVCPIMNDGRPDPHKE